MSKLTDQINAYNRALQNKTWVGDWQGGGEGAVTSAAQKLESLGVKDIQDLKVEKNIIREPAIEMYQGRQVGFDPVSQRKYQWIEEFTAGPDSPTVPVVRYLPANTPTVIVKAVQEQVGTGDNLSYGISYYPLTAQEQATVDPKTGTYEKVAGNRLVDTSTGKTISTSTNNNFLIDTYSTGNFLKGKDKSFGFIANEQGQVVPYQTSERAGFTSSFAFPIMMAMIAPGVSGLIGGATGLTGAGLSAATGATLGAGTAALTDQNILTGALTGGLVGGASSLVTPAISGALGGGQVGNIAAGALTGGGIAELTGGDFLQGALRGGASAGLSGYQQQLRQEQFDTGMTESGLAGQTSIEDIVPPAAVISEPTIQDVISQITVPTQEQFQPSIDQLITELAPFEFVPGNIDLSQLEGFDQTLVSPSADSSFVGPRQGVTVQPDFQIQTPSTDELLAALAQSEVLPELVYPSVADQTVLTQEQLQPSINELITQLAPYEVLPEITLPTQIEQTVTTQEQLQPSIDQLIAELAPYEAIPEITITAPREQTVPTQEEMQPVIDELIAELAPYEVIPEAIDTSAGLQTVPTQEEMQLSVDELLTELAPYEVPVNEVIAEPDVQPAPVDNSKLIAVLDVLKVISPAVITAILADNATQTTTQTPEQTGFPIVPIPGDWRSPTYNQAFTPSAPIDFGTPALLAGTQWENLPQFQQEQPYNLSNLINTLNYQSIPFEQAQYQVPQQTLNVNDVVSQYRTTPTVGTKDIIDNLGGKPVSIADIISGIQSQYG